MKSNSRAYKILILGVTGFSGKATLYHLEKYNKYNIFGTYRHSTSNRSISFQNSNITFYECDISNILSIEAILESIKPDVILHYCGYVSVMNAIKNPHIAYKTNVIGTINLLESVKNIVPKAKVLLPGSAEVYGSQLPKNMPIIETEALNPLNPYALSKRSQEEVGLYYFNQLGLKIYLTRTFHCTGPFQPSGFVCSDFAKQIVDAEKSKGNVINTGNLKVKRDFTDIRDIINAYFIILNTGKPGEIYNICSGYSIEIKDILDKMLLMTSEKIKVKINKSKFRKADVLDFVGSNEKLKSLGWSPKISIDQSLEDLINWTRLQQ